MIRKSYFGVSSMLKNIRNILRDRIIIQNYKQQLQNQTPCIISSNCIGGIIYHDLQLPFLSPTINLFFYPQDYLKFIGKLKYYLSINLLPSKSVNGTEYPVGLLDDIEVHFLHYKDFKDAAIQWQKRVNRVDFDNLFFIMTDQNGCTYEQIKYFDTLQYKNKVIFTHKSYPEFNSAFYIKDFENNNEVGNLINIKKYSLKRYFEDFDYVSFFNGGKK